MILSTIIKIVATSCQILRLKCSKFYTSAGALYTPDPTGELTALPSSLAGFKGPTSKMRKRKDKGGGRKWRRGEGERGWGGWDEERRKGKGRDDERRGERGEGEERQGRADRGGRRNGRGGKRGREKMW